MTHHRRQTPSTLKTRLTVTLLLALPAAVASAQNADPYATGMRALNQQRWPDAVAAFSRVADSRGKKADAALYWKAYSLNKLGNASLANATCTQLHTTYSASSWNRDCTALDLGQNGVPNAAEIQNLQKDLSDLANSGDLKDLAAGARSQDPSNSDADLKILALNSLMNRDPAQAIPILRNLLASNQSNDVKQHAIFVLAQSTSPEAQHLMHDLVVGHVSPSLQRQAIQMSGITEGKRGNDTLEEVYRTTSNPQIKAAVISAFFVSGDSPRMVHLAREEKNLEQKRSIVSQLALMQDKAATDYMLELLK